MNQRYDLLAFAFLLLSAILAVWLTVGPTNFVLKDWQPLMASFVALGAATLAYKAAMAKVEFDRHIVERQDKRKALGLCLRLEFAMQVLRHQAEMLRDKIPARVTSKAFKLEMKTIDFETPEALVEAWQNLDAFPPPTAQRLADIQAQLYDFKQLKGVVDHVVWDLKAWDATPEELQSLRFIASELEHVTDDAGNQIRTMIAFLQ
ncbi:hypothetical protein XH83_15390 [Bradyrhizobium sp. CCBAU 53351]|uniref:hypothetical protein n=1 Tax=Bradyrhizobium sp. CCBAU 53351 TaxID=1325114 RepID=UPI00188782D4|nr:hypothetical protein [Bradyrhizobium sp. CCBAU 53351]QOZ76713.1 hypothetical protein XH83_15390 [Bradyrhizobium sp. CCBAU 53351]